MSNTTGYIVYDTKKGAYDGVYLHKVEAEKALKSLQRRVLQANWVLHEHTKSPELPAAKFWLNIYEKEYTQGE